MVIGRICLADGSLAVMRTRRISMVYALAVTVPAVDVDTPDHDLDGEHYSHLFRLAFTCTWTSVVGSGLDHVARIRISSNGRSDSSIVPHHATGSARMLRRLGSLRRPRKQLAFSKCAHSERLGRFVMGFTEPDEQASCAV